MRKRKWTADEEEHLRTHILTDTRLAISKHINCPLSVLSRKLVELRLATHKISMRKPMPTVGQTINRLTILQIIKSGGSGVIALCQCQCGNKSSQRLSSIASGRIKSCGCLKAELASARLKKSNYKHGLSHLKTNRLYRIWCVMKCRCSNTKLRQAADYVGRGIRVCDEWIDDYVAFHKWSMSHGYEDHLTIDRINVDGNYEPSNCQWITKEEQGRNKRNTVRITAFGVTKRLIEWVEDPRCNANNGGAIVYRISAGWPPEDAISKTDLRCRPQ